MINLRFHIVSIVAVFLALAIGILTGSTLLDRATVEVLQGRQRSLDSRNGELRTENDQLRSVVRQRTEALTAFGADALPGIIDGVITDSPVLFVAMRGIDEDSVRAAQSAVRDAGGSPLGIVWFDARFDLDDPAALAAIADVLDASGADKKLRATIIDRIAEGLAASADDSAFLLPTTTTTSTAPAVEDLDPNITVPIEGTAPAVDDPSLSVLSQLADADLIDWESASDGEPGARTLPAGGLEVVLVSGEGAELSPSRLVYPLARALSAQTPGLVVGEVRSPRTDLDVLDANDVPVRGALVDELRGDDVVSGQLITIDNLDEPFGRLSLVLSLADLPDSSSGAYGVADSADQAFPTAPR